MAVWRRKLLRLFPELHAEAAGREFSPYDAFFALRQQLRSAHEKEDCDQLASIYGFAQWCLNQTAKDLWNSAGVGFYEHLFEMPKTTWPKIVEWLSPHVVANCRSLWKARLEDDEWTRIEELIRTCKSPRYTQLDDRTRAV